MRNLTKLVATAALGVAMSATFSAPSYAFMVTENVKEASTYFFDCLAKLGTDDTCGGPHEMDKGTSSIGGGKYGKGPECAWYEVRIGGECYCWWETEKSSY